MNRQEIEDKIKLCFSNLGYSDEENYSETNILSDILVNSIMFISFIIELEETFEFEIPDDYLSFEMFDTFDKIVLLIEGLLEES